MKRTAWIVAALSVVIASTATHVLASDRPYSEGTVWSLSFIKTQTGKTDDYVKNLGAGWKPVMEEAKKQGLILSYKVILSDRATPADWELLLMLEFKNMAAMDGWDEKERAIVDKVFGTHEKAQTDDGKRNEIREILGSKLAREIIIK